MSKALEPLIERIAQSDPAFAAHLRKTVDSIEDNTAEGGMATTPGRKANFFRMGRDSGGELDGQLMRAARRGLIINAERIAVQLILNETVFLLNRLVIKWEREADGGH